MSTKLTIKEVKKRFKDGGCELLEKVYINCSTKMRYECECEREDTINLVNFSSGQRCKECAIEKRASKTRLSYEEVKKYFEDRGCKLLEKKYINSKTLMRYLCKNNHLCKVAFSNFKFGRGCMECGGNKKYIFEEVKKYFKDHDCELLEIEYINNHTPMNFRCSCTNKAKITFSAFKKGGRCSKCGHQKKAEKRRHTIDYVRSYFEKYGYELLEIEYKNVKTDMRYKCPNGHIGKTKFYNFQSGKRCRTCYLENNYGEGNPRYNPNLTDEEREKNRSRPGCNKWKKLILERDKNTCQCCFQIGGKLIAHHIEAYTPNKELRTVVSNGFLFCEEHHNLFHKIYGYDCNRKQLNEFLKIGVNNE